MCSGQYMECNAGSTPATPILEFAEKEFEHW